MSVLAIWHAGEEIFTDIADVTLAFGDALLLQGPRAKMKVIADDPDLILLLDDDVAPFRLLSWRDETGELLTDERPNAFIR